ncbi:MAG TPA: hypothetical protein VFB08_10745 [Burkholderiales bacterium]|nr:hypothetical protein [Burkholderiales bacterium]
MQHVQCRGHAQVWDDQARMIQFLVTREHAYTMQSFLASWGRDLAGRIGILSYEDLIAGAEFTHRDTAFIFSDLDRLAAWPQARALIARMHGELNKRYGAGRTLNDPERSLLRFPLLRLLHEQGINRFNVYRPGEGPPPRRFPVFLRPESGHEPGKIVLLRDEAAYRAALDELVRQGAPIKDYVAVEFCDTSTAGLYRKYGAFVVGDRIVPRHIFFSRDWLVKMPDLAEPAMIEEERAFMASDAHAEVLRATARAARIEYGRIDYGLLAGRPQVWEINTNPMLASAISDGIPARREAHLRFVAAIAEAFRAIDPARER